MSDRISVGGDHSKKDILKSVPLIIQFEELDKQLFADMMQTTGWGTSVIIVIQEDSLLVILPNLVLFIDEDDHK